MSHSVDGGDHAFLVLINDERQYSLWPADLDVPVGWAVTHGPATHAVALQRVEQQWTDMRPASLAGVSDASVDRR